MRSFLIVYMRVRYSLLHYLLLIEIKKGIGIESEKVCKRVKD